MYVAPESKILMALAVAAGASEEPVVTTTKNPDSGEGDEWE